MNFRYKFKFFNSLGGVSDGVFRSLNCHKYSGDDVESVELNRKIVLNHFNGESNRLFFMKQIHSNRIFELTSCDQITQSDLVECDAVVTDLSNILIAVLTADCLPILMYDKNSGVMVACHAGWRGVYSDLFGKLFDLLIQNYKCNPNDIKIFIGPHIKQKSYIVQEKFMKDWMILSEDFKKFFKRNNNGYNFDLSGAAVFKMIKIGFIEKNIKISRIDTYSNTNYFSYRRSLEKNKDCENSFGRNVSVIIKY